MTTATKDKAEDKVRWKRVADGHYVAHHDDWHLIRKNQYRRGSEWHLHYGDPNGDTPRPAVGIAFKKKNATKYLERRMAADIERRRRAEAAEEAKSLGRLRIPVTNASEVVEIKGIEKYRLHLLLEEFLDEAHRRMFLVRVSGYMASGGGHHWRLGVIMEGINSCWLRGAEYLSSPGSFEGGDPGIDEGMGWQNEWRQCRNYWNSDYRSAAINLFEFQMSRGAEMMARDAHRREVHTEACAEAINNRAAAEEENP